MIFKISTQSVSLGDCLRQEITENLEQNKNMIFTDYLLDFKEISTRSVSIAEGKTRIEDDII